MARNIKCKCEYNFTCGFCLRNVPPYFFTLSDGSAIYETREWGRQTYERRVQSLEDDGLTRSDAQAVVDAEVQS